MHGEPGALSRIVTVEEHITFPDLVSQLPDAEAIERGYRSAAQPFVEASLTDPMKDTEARIARLDEAGITVQVLSYPYAGTDLLAPREGRRWAAEMNDRIAARVAAHPHRYAAFAHLPLTDPEAAADELERAVTDLAFKGVCRRRKSRGHHGWKAVRLPSLRVPQSKRRECRKSCPVRVRAVRKSLGTQAVSETASTLRPPR